MKPYYQDSLVTLYHGDCREILPQLKDVTAIVSDPPYGMRWNGKVTRGKSDPRVERKTQGYGCSITGDDQPFNPSHLLNYKEVLLWGFNHFPQALLRGTVLVWLKRYDEGFGSFLSDAEVAWLNKGHGVYCKRDVSLQGESKHRLHPTQKPLNIMSWCLTFIDSVCLIDPYVGSGTTLEAAKLCGKKAIGIEIEERYCEITAKRMMQETLPFTHSLSAKEDHSRDIEQLDTGKLYGNL